jgi:hypothetical protein
MPRPKVSLDEVFCKAETEDAILCSVPNQGLVWIPKSQVDDDSEVQERNDTGTLIISEWWAEKKDLI